MAELYESPKQYVSLGGQSGTASDAPPSIQSVIDSLPADEREEALKYITAPPTGEEIARAMAEKNSRGELMEMSLDQYRLFKAHQKSKETDVIGTIGEAASTVFEEISKAAGSVYDKPVDSLKKLTPSVIEAFAQGTRNLYGMAAQSADPTSVFFRMKNALQANGDDEAAEYQQFMEAQAFNLHSMRLMTGQDTIIMDKDVINPEMTQVMSYIADPTLFIPFGGIAAKGATMVGMGEKLALASAKTAAIKRMVLGGTLKWGVGAPIEFMGTAVRNTIDYGLERSAKAFETVTGMPAAEVKTTAQMYGWTSASAAMTGANVPFPIVGDVAGAMVGSTTARGVGEAVSMFGEQMMKQKNTGRGVLGYAGQALRDTKKQGVVLSKHAEGLLKIIESVDPLFAYADEITEGAFQGAAIGGGLGYLAGGEEGMAGGIGSGMALGAVGAGAGRFVSDVTGNTKMEQIAIQRKLVIEGLKDAGNENHVALEAMAIAAEATGDRRFQAQIDGIIAGLDVVNPDVVIRAFNESQYKSHLEGMGIDPNTGKLREKSRIFPEIGDRRTIADVLSILRDNGGNFAGDPAGFERAVMSEPRYAKLKPIFERLDDNAKSVLLKQIESHKDQEFIKSIRGGELKKNRWNQLNDEIDKARKELYRLREEGVNVTDPLYRAAFDKLLKLTNELDSSKINPSEEVTSTYGNDIKRHYSDIAYAERLAESINTLNQNNANLVADKIAETLKTETRFGKLTRRGQMLKEKLQADGYIDKDGTIRKSRNMDVEETLESFDASAGWNKRRNSTGQTEIVINLDKFMAKGNRESMPHELFHSVMRDSVFAKDYSDRLIQKLVGTFDPQTGKMLEKAVVDPTQLQKFMEGYINSVHRNRSEEFRKRKIDELKGSIEEYKKRTDPNRIADATQTPLEHLVEEFGAYYFAKFVMDKPVDFLFRGGEFSGLRAVFESSKESFLDFWKAKISKNNPSVNFDNIEGYALSRGFGKDGKRVKVTALDLLMQDMIRMQSNINKGGRFNIGNLSPDARKQFIQTHGLRGQGFETIDKAGNLKKPKLRRYTAEEIRQGKEMFKVLDSLSDADHRGGMRRDGDGNWSGRPNTAQMNALVGTGYLQRAWFDRLNFAYNILDGKGSNVVEFGYLGYSAHIGDGNERVYGAAVPFKNRRAILLDVNFKVRADGTTFANFDTLDLKVIEARGNEVWRDPQVRDLWNGDRTSMEADFYAYLSNASLPSNDPNRKPSFRLLDRGDGLGGQRRDALHQMLGFHKGSDLPYINKPIAEIPVGIRHSVTTFSNDGIVAMRTAGNERVDYSHNNAHLDLSRNFMPDELREEKTPSGGKILKHATGYNISKQAGEKFKVFDPEGKMLGAFDTVADAGRAAQKHFNDTFDKSVEGKDKPVPNTETPPSRQAFIEREFEKASATYNNTFVGGKDNFINNVKVLLDRFINGREDIGVGEGYIERAKKLKASIEKNGNIKLSELEELSKLGAGIMHDTSRLPYYNYDFFWQATGDLLSEHLKKAGERYDNMYPMEIKSALHPRLAQIFQDYPNLTAQGLLKKLVVYGSQGSRMFQEATEIGLVDLLKSKIQKTTTPRFLPDGTRIDMAQGVTQPKLDMTEILDFAKSKEIKVTIEEGARERSGMDTSRYTLGGAKDNYKETAIRINPEYAHGVRGHYGEDTIVHFRTTERLDADGNRHLYVEEVQANNTDQSKGEYITPEQVRVSKELAKRVVANRYADELEKRELNVARVEDEVEALSAYAAGKNPDFSSRRRVDKVRRQKEAFNLILRNYIDIYKQNYSDFLKDLEESTGTPDAPYGSKTLSRDVRQHWLNTKQIIESGMFLKELEKHFLTSSDPAETWKTLLEFYDKNEYLQSERRNRGKGSLPSLDDTLQEKVYGTLYEISNGAGRVLDSIADLGYYIRANNQDGVNNTISRIGNYVSSIDVSIGRLKNMNHGEIIGRETFIEGLKDLANKDKTVQRYADAKIELDKYHDLVISDINSIGNFSHINRGEGRIESVHSDLLREYVSLANTSIDKFNTQGKEPVFPLTSARDWTLTGLKGIIRQAIRDGLDRVTLTHPDDSPTVSHMKREARHGLYGKLIPEVWGAWLRKYGIEMKQTNKLADATIDTAKAQMAEITNKLHDANKAVLEHFEQVKTGEDATTINKLAQLMAMPVHEADNKTGARIRVEALKVNDDKLRTLINHVSLLKETELDSYNRINKLRESGIRGDSTLKSDTDAGISAEAIDRGMTFELNDRIKRDFLDGKIQTHMMPAEGEQGGRVYDQNSNEWKAGFIGKYAEENPDRIKNKNIEFVKRKDGSYRITLTDNSGATKKIGHITADLDMSVNGEGVAEISSNLDPKFRGNKLANVLYSEMAERLRAMGVKYVDGTIVNKDGIPVQVRNTIIGQTYFKGSNKPATMQETAKKVQAIQSVYPSRGIGVYNELDPKARYQPAEYQGGDDYYKPKKNPFESKDEQGFNIRSYHYYDEKTGKYVKNPDALDWMDIGHGNDDNNAGMWYLDDNNGKIEQANVSEYPIHEDLFNDIGEEHSIKGRIEYPVYKNGKLTKRGRISIAEPVPSLRDAPDVKELKNIKAKVAKSYGFKIDDIDAFYFGQNEGVKNAFGYGVRDQLPVKFMPAEGEQEPIRLSGKMKTISTKKVSTNQYEMGEGNRIYDTNSRQWTNGFIGRYAEENPILTKGLKLSMKNWDNRTDDYGRRSIELKEGNKLVGRIDYEVKKGSGGKWLLSDPTVRVWEQYRGKGYSNLLYSEMAERARFLGAEDFLQRIENDLALPMYAQVNTFGFGESKLIDADRGQYFPPTKENFDKLKKPKIDIMSKDGSVETVEGYEPWVHSWSKIFSDRHYMPAEGWRDWQSERTSLGSVVKNAVGYVIMVQGDKFKVYNPYKALVGIYNDLEQAKRRVQRDEPKQ